MANVIVDVGLPTIYVMHTTGMSFNAIGRQMGYPLYCNQPIGEKTHTNQQCERLAKIRQTTGNI
jgi:hypothetical protein